MSMIKFLSSINHRIGRGNVRTKQKKDKYFFEHAYKDLTQKELAVVTEVEELAVEYKEGIKFDLDTGEILIEIPDGLVILKSGKVELYKKEGDHTGFAFAIIPDTAYERVSGIVRREARRERRRLKNQYNESYVLFVKSMRKPQTRKK